MHYFQNIFSFQFINFFFQYAFFSLRLVNDYCGLCEYIFFILQNGFKYPNNKYVTVKLEKQVKRQYRGRRKNYHKHFQQFSSKEEALKNHPKKIKYPEDWIFLRDLFSSEEYKVVSLSFLL